MTSPPCVICGEPVTVDRRDRIPKTCRRRPCVKRLISRTMQGYVPSVAIAEAKRDRAARIQAQLQFYFGTLSEREIALYQHVYKVAYQRGYNRGMRRPPSRGALVPGQAA